VRSTTPTEPGSGGGCEEVWYLTVPNAAPYSCKADNGPYREVRIEVDTNRPSVVVLADTYQKDWSATVDGQPTHLGRVDDVVRGVVVPAGHSTVVFRYRSPARTIGLVISVLSLATLLVGAIWWRRRAKRTDARPGPSGYTCSEPVAIREHHS